MSATYANLMLSESATVPACAAVVFDVLSDVGGWRIWNHPVVFADMDGQVQAGALGLLYVRPLKRLRWRLQVVESIAGQRLVLRIGRLGFWLKLVVNLHENSDSSAPSTRLEAQMMPLGSFAARTHRLWQSFWRPFLQALVHDVAFVARKNEENQAQKGNWRAK